MSWPLVSGRREAEAELRRIAGLDDRAVDLAPAALAFAALFRVWTRAILISLFVAHFFLVRVFAGLANQSEVLAPYFLIFLLFVDFRPWRRKNAKTISWKLSIEPERLIVIARISRKLPRPNRYKQYHKRCYKNIRENF